VERLVDGADHAIVIAAVRDIVVGPEDAPLIRFRRAYHELEP
jgi:flavin reductase (DIM6/NTAB) family NADH-FMN oxidoreductase RutF